MEREAHVAARILERLAALHRTADIAAADRLGKAHEPLQGQRVLDQLEFQGDVVGVLDREGDLVLAQLEVQLPEGFVVEVGVDDLGRGGELQLHAVVERACQGAPQIEPHALDEERRAPVAPFVARLHVAREAGKAVEAVKPRVAGRSLRLQRRDFGRQRFERRRFGCRPRCGIGRGGSWGGETRDRGSRDGGRSRGKDRGWGGGGSWGGGSWGGGNFGGRRLRNRLSGPGPERPREQRKGQKRFHKREIGVFTAKVATPRQTGNTRKYLKRGRAMPGPDACGKDFW